MDVSRFLRPDERVLVLIPCRTECFAYVDDDDGSDDELTEVDTDAEDEIHTDIGLGRPPTPAMQRAKQGSAKLGGLMDAVGAVIAGKGSQDGAALMLYSTQAPSFTLLHTIPITPHLDVSLSQAPPSPTASHFQQSARPPIRLRLSRLSPHNPLSVDLVIPAKLTAETDRLVKEVRRLVDVERRASSARILPPAWLGYYPDVNQVHSSSRADIERVDESDALAGAVQGVRVDSADGPQHLPGQEPGADGLKGAGEGEAGAAGRTVVVPVEDVLAPAQGREGGQRREGEGEGHGAARDDGGPVGTGQGDEAVDRVLALAPPIGISTATHESTSPSSATSPPASYFASGPPSASASASASTTASASASAPTSAPRPVPHPPSSSSSPASTAPPVADAHQHQYPNPHAPQFDRTAFFRQRIYARQAEWSEGKEVMVRVGTFNVNDRLPVFGEGEGGGDGIEGVKGDGEGSGKEGDKNAPAGPGSGSASSDQEQGQGRGGERLGGLVGTGEEDVLAFGFQEVDLRSSAMIISQGASRADEWTRAILAGLGAAGDQYERIAVTQYVGVLLIVFVRRELRDAVAEVQTSEKGIGLLGFGGNKAGVAVRFKLHDTTFCFVNSHLAAFANALDRRRTDYATLNASLTFPIGSANANAGGDDPRHPERLGEFALGKARTLEDCHALFWMGDLNYRVDMPDDILSAWVEEGKYAQILEKDQLRQDIGSGKSFAGFHEGVVDFAPTYKYVHGSASYDPKRAPAYTDRILFRPPLQTSTFASSILNPITTPVPGAVAGAGTSIAAASPSTPSLSANASPTTTSMTLVPAPSSSLSAQPPTSITCDRYGSHNVRLSDHRPVSGTYTTHVRVPDEAKRIKVVEEIRRELERLEVVYKPGVEMSGREVDFGEVRYRQLRTESIRITNAGRVPALLSFKSMGPRSAICKPFYWVHPPSATLQPDDVLDLHISCFVGEDWARRLTAGEDMDDVLVLQVAEGMDTFIPLSATFLPTLISIPLCPLSETPAPVRQIPHDERRNLFSDRPIRKARPSTSDPYANSKGASASRPVKEVWRCLEYLMEPPPSSVVEGKDKEIGIDEGLVGGLWLPDAEEEEGVLAVIECLDTGTDLPPASARAISLALLHILQSLPEPLIPREKLDACALAKDRDEAFECLEGMPGVDTNVLIGLMSVVKLNLSRSAKDASITQAPPELVSILADSIFGPSLPSSSLDGRLRFAQLLMDG